MVQYTPQLDAQIAALLVARRRVSAGDLAGIDPGDAPGLLGRYVELHPEQAVTFDGSALLLTEAGSGTSPAVPDPGEAFPETRLVDYQSPLDSVIGYSGQSALDTKASEPKISAAMWMISIFFLLPGGIVAWLMTRKDSPRGARGLLWVSLVFTLLNAALGVAISPVTSGLKDAAAPQQASQATVAWAASASGHPMLFYFGDTSSAGGSTMAPIVQGLEGEYSGKVDFTVYPDIEADAAVKAFAAEKGVSKTPTTVVVSPAGKELQRWSEPTTPAQLRTALDSALQTAP